MKTLKNFLYLTAILLGSSVTSCMHTNNQPEQANETQEQANEPEEKTEAQGELISFKADNGLYGFRDETGKTVIEPKYAEIFDVSEYDEENFALVNIGTSDDIRLVLIDKKGEFVVDPISINSIAPPPVYDPEQLQEMLNELEPTPELEIHRVTVPIGVEGHTDNDIDISEVGDNYSFDDLLIEEGYSEDSIYMEYQDYYSIRYHRKDVHIDTMQVCAIPESILEKGSIKMYDKHGNCTIVQKTLVAARDLNSDNLSWGIYKFAGISDDRIYFINGGYCSIQYDLCKIKNNDILIGLNSWYSELKNMNALLYYIPSRQVFYNTNAGFLTIDKSKCSSLPE